MLSTLLDYVLCRPRYKTMKEKLDDAEAAVTAATQDQKPTLTRTLSIRIPRTASCERCYDTVVVSPAEAVTPEWQCGPCAAGGSGRPRAPRACC